MASHAGLNVLEASPEPKRGFGGLAGGVAAPRDDAGGNFGNIWAALRTLQGDDVVQGSAAPRYDQELKLIVPLASSVSVGQRFEVCLENRDPIMGRREPMVDGQYATVFRTEIVNQGGGKALSIDLRMDQPLVL